MSTGVYSGVTLGRSILWQWLAVMAFGGLSFASLCYAGEIERHVSPVWPASGLAVAIVFFMGRYFCFAIFIGSFASNAITTWQTLPGSHLWIVLIPSACIGLGAAMEALIASSQLSRRAGGREFCLSSANATAFVLRVAMLASAVSALIGPTALMACGVILPERWLIVALTWFVGDVTGILVFGAALVFPWRCVDWQLLRNRWQESLLLVISLAVIGAKMTGAYESRLASDWPLAYLILPVMLWAVFRFTHLGALAALLMVTALSLGGSALGHEVFPSDQPGFALFFLQMFLLIIAAAVWTICGRVNELQILTGRLEALVTQRVLAQRQDLQRREERLSVLAHDLQVPLIGIRNLVELLQNPRHAAMDEGNFRRLFGEIGHAAEQARGLAGRLLGDGEIESMQSFPEPVDWVELVRAVVRRVSLLEVARELKFSVQAEETHLNGSVDRVVLVEVLENLCHNAAKVSPKGGTVTIGLRSEADAVVLTIADEGPGFRGEEIPALFTQAGFRERIRSRSGSTGLGLFITGQAVRSIGGAISCESQQDKGTCFTIRLPRAVG